VHLFVLCDLPRQVWPTSNPPISTHLLNPNEDGVQLSLAAVITSNPTKATLSKTLFIMWYIWKARNDNQFQRMTWTPFQVHKAETSHLQTHLSAWEDYDSNLYSQYPQQPTSNTQPPNSNNF
jgi:hypothetical protein